MTTLTNMSYKLYSLPDYKKDLDFIENNYSLYTIDELVNELSEYDNNYHFRVQPNTQYTFFTDIDSGDFNDIITKLINPPRQDTGIFAIDISIDISISHIPTTTKIRTSLSAHPSFCVVISK